MKVWTLPWSLHTYKGQVIVSWANIHLVKGDVEISTYWNETGRVLVIIGSFYADTLCVLGTNHELLSDHTWDCSSPVFGELQGQKTLVYLVSDALKECLFYVPFEGFARHPLWGAWEDCNQQSKSNPVKWCFSVLSDRYFRDWQMIQSFKTLYKFPGMELL